MLLQIRDEMRMIYQFIVYWNICCHQAAVLFSQPFGEFQLFKWHCVEENVRHTGNGMFWHRADFLSREELSDNTDRSKSIDKRK